TGTRQGWVEYREHSSLEFLAARHRDRRGRSVGMAYGGHDVEQVLGILAGTRAEADGQVVAGALTGVAQTARGGPGQWMKPVEGTGDAAQRVTVQVATADMSELVDQHRVALFRRPTPALRRQHDRGLPDAGGERHMDVAALQEHRWIIE